MSSKKSAIWNFTSSSTILYSHVVRVLPVRKGTNSKLSNIVPRGAGSGVRQRSSSVTMITSRTKTRRRHKICAEVQDKNQMMSYTSAMTDIWALKLSGDSWQTSVGREFHIGIAHGKKVCPCWNCSAPACIVFRMTSGTNCYWL